LIIRSNLSISAKDVTPRFQKDIFRNIPPEDERIWLGSIPLGGYGLHDVGFGMPVQFGPEGIKIIEFDLRPREKMVSKSLY